MVIDKDDNKIYLIKSKSEESKIIFIYRYFSLIITSFFYFTNNSVHSFSQKLFIVVCISISSIILSYLYLKNENSKKNIKFLVLIEIIGNSFILIPSGGLTSPFVWYALNTILISALLLNKRYSWINMIVYLLLQASVVYFFDKGEIGLLELIDNESNLILSFILITAAIQLWARYVRRIKENGKRLSETNNQLILANKKIKESIDYIMDLYQTVHIFNNQGNKNSLIRLLIDYTKKITKSNTAFFYDIYNNTDTITTDEENSIIESLKNNLLENLKNIDCSKLPIEIQIENKKFLVAAVKSSYKDYGLLGFGISNCDEEPINQENTYQIKFLSELSSIVFEKFYLEEVSQRLLITEEQNRIADEIHDSVLQRLFSMSCGIFVLMNNLEKQSYDKTKEELNIIRSSTNKAMKELRSTIYGLSWKKNGLNSFETDITNYIDDIKRLNNVEITFDIFGNHELINSKQKKALYRIICEGISNAVRHGKANDINVSLDVQADMSLLNIYDNGIGFELARVLEDKSKGLGINNIHYLVDSLKGQIKIDSQPGKGTKIEIIIPNESHIIRKEVVV